jgi:hypothetical protein
MILTGGKKVLGEKSVPEPLCPPQISHSRTSNGEGKTEFKDTERKGQRKRKRRAVTDFYIRGGGEEYHLLDGSQAAPARPSGSSSMEMEMYEK